jgi:hypothetical protein
MAKYQTLAFNQITGTKQVGVWQTQTSGKPRNVRTPHSHRFQKLAPIQQNNFIGLFKNCSNFEQD